MQSMVIKDKATVKTVQKIAMGLGDLGYSMVGNTMSSFILFFGNTVMGVPGTLMGVALALGTMWDAVTDPICGYISDNTKNRIFGRRHLYILIGIITMAFFNILLWSVPKEWGSLYKFIWFTLGLITMDTCFTIFATPNAALSIEISRDYNEKSSIQAYKSVFMIIGLLLPTLLMGAFQTPTAEYPDGRFNPMAYVNYSYAASASVIVLGAIMFIATYSHIPRLRTLAERETKANKSGLKDIFKSFFGTLKNKSFRSVIIGYSVAMMSATLIVAFGFNVFTFTFKTSTMQMYIVMAGMFAMTIAGQPLWLYVSKKTDKKTAIISGFLVSLAGAVMLFILFLFRHPLNRMLLENPANLIIFMLPLMVAGLGSGVLYSLPLALISDAITVEKAQTSEDKTGTYTGFMTLAYKGSRSITQLILSSLLDIIGFKAGSSVQTPFVESALGWILCIGVTIAFIGGIIIFLKYKVTREDVSEAIKKLAAAAETNNDKN